MDFKALVFDCDGVIFDSREANRAYYNTILKGIGLPLITEEQLHYAHCYSVFEVINFLISDPSLQKKAHHIRKNIDYKDFLPYMKLETDVIDVLKAFKPLVRIAMATNRTNTIYSLLKTYNLDKYFEVVISALDVKNTKPHPEALYKIMDIFHVTPSEILYIGDAKLDAEMAKKANVTFGAYKNKELEADFYLQGFLELKEIIIKF
jgi:HAD superfamily hydrolase (TIGR01549 family)